MIGCSPWYTTPETMNVKRTLAALLTLTAVAACDVEDYPLCVLAPVYEGPTDAGDRVHVEPEDSGDLYVELQFVDGTTLDGTLTSGQWSCDHAWSVALADGVNVSGVFDAGQAWGTYEIQGVSGTWTTEGLPSQIGD